MSTLNYVRSFEKVAVTAPASAKDSCGGRYSQSRGAYGRQTAIRKCSGLRQTVEIVKETKELN